MSEASELDLCLQRALDHHVAGRLGEAEAGYREALRLGPGNATALHRLGILYLQGGRAQAALDAFRQALARDPAAWRTRCGEGRALAALGRPGEAVQAFRSALAAGPDALEARLGLGGALRDAGDAEGAARTFAEAEAQAPGNAEAASGLGDALQALGRPGEALAAYGRALEADPGRAETLNNLGVALLALGRAGEAVQAFRAVLALREDFPEAHLNLGKALLDQGDRAGALALLSRAAARWPGVAGLHFNLGNARFAMGDFPGAAGAFARAASLDPDPVRALNNLGNALQAQGRFKEALDVYREALERRPDFLDTYNNASAAARALGLLDEAEAHLRRSLELDPAFQPGHGNLGSVLKEAGRIGEAIAEFRRALELDPGDAVTHSNLVYALSFLPGQDAGAILEAARGWDRAHGEPLRAGIPPHPNARDPRRRLKVGYVSPNFREHVLAHFLVPLLSNHDPAEVELLAYSLSPRQDAVTARLRPLFHHWRDAAGLSDADLARLVREDGADVLVDLTMHMGGGRPGLFARKPAPVQVAWLAYPGTTGLSAMDWRLTDPFLDPPGAFDGDYSERSLRLPDVFSCYDPLAEDPRPGPLPALARGRVTFGSFNHFGKINDPLLVQWCRILREVEGSRLLLLAPGGGPRRRFLDRCGELGVGPERIAFTGFLPRADYLAAHREVDLCLDTFPYNGHTTSLDALWMGVPVATRAGRTVVGRTCWTLLCNLDLRELAATTEEDYVRKAVDLARDLPRLSRLRAELRPRMMASPLMDAPRFARAMERAYREMWTAWCSGKP